MHSRPQRQHARQLRRRPARGRARETPAENQRGGGKMGDLERLMRAVRTIERLAWKHDCKDAAAVLMEHCSCKDRDAAAFAGYWLVEVWELNRKAHQESNPRCVECGDDVEGKRDVVRSDASYCSPA